MPILLCLSLETGSANFPDLKDIYFRKFRNVSAYITNTGDNFLIR